MDETMVQSGDIHQGTPSEPVAECKECTQAESDEEMAFAFLLALMPVMSLTFFGNMGLL